LIHTGKSNHQKDFFESLKQPTTRRVQHRGQHLNSN
jgi:hypothetical protein